MADVAGYHGGDGGDEPSHGHSYKVPTSCESYKPTKRRSSGKNLNLYDKFQKNESRPLPIEFDYSSNLYRAVGENYHLFIRLISNEVDRYALFHYRSWQEVPGDVKMSILTTLHVSILTNVFCILVSYFWIWHNITIPNTGMESSLGFKLTV
ncbi:hypothetical protein R6Q57_002016 [Mikania cordata]